LELDLTGQTSASYNMRLNYEKCLLEFEKYLAFGQYSADLAAGTAPPTHILEAPPAVRPPQGDCAQRVTLPELNHDCAVFAVDNWTEVDLVDSLWMTLYQHLGFVVCILPCRPCNHRVKSFALPWRCLACSALLHDCAVAAIPAVYSPESTHVCFARVRYSL